MLRFILVIGFLNACIHLNAQELFPYAEPASTIPKGVVGFRVSYQSYKELSTNRIKNWYGLRSMYGLTSKWTVMSTLGISNHHFEKFPPEILLYLFNHHLIKYKPAPYLIEGINFYSKYRFYTFDQHHKHIRLSFISETCKSFIAHDEAEPTLMTDNSGFGLGLIGTFLINRFAISATAEYIHPFLYKQKSDNITFKSGDGKLATISAGYRLWPIKYSSYSNFNLNIYVEFTLKQFEGSEITKNGNALDYKSYFLKQPYALPISYNALNAGSYIEGRYFIQVISNSNNRVDLGVTMDIKNRSYNHWNPMVNIQYQAYVFNNKRKNISIK